MKLILPTCVAIVVCFAEASAAAENPAVDDALFTAITRCWNAVDGDGLAVLEPFNMTLEARKDVASGQNETYLGQVSTQIGTIEIRATVRGGVLFDCTMHTFPVRNNVKSIAYEDSRKTLAQWFGDRLAWYGYLDASRGEPFFGLIRCAADRPTITVFAVAMDPSNPDDFIPGEKLVQSGMLRLAAYRRSSDFSVRCKMSGAL